MNSSESKSECLTNGDKDDDDFQFSISDIKTPQPGSVVQCETKVATITGQVLQCENGLLVVLQSDGPRKQMRFINLLHVNNLTVVKEASPNFGFDLPGASWEEANKRLEKAERLKRSLCINADAPIEAIRTFGTLKKLYNEDVVWDGKVLKVLRCLVIRFPFDENSVECINKEASTIRAMEQIKKILAQQSMKANDQRSKQISDNSKD